MQSLGMMLLCLLSSPPCSIPKSEMQPGEETWPCCYTPSVWLMPAQRCSCLCGVWFWLGFFFSLCPWIFSHLFVVMVLLQPWVNKHCRHCVVFEVSPLVPRQTLFRQRPWHRQMVSLLSSLLLFYLEHCAFNESSFVWNNLLCSLHLVLLSFADGPRVCQI